VPLGKLLNFFDKLGILVVVIIEGEVYDVLKVVPGTE
jgi:hypothetical protein